jgi:Peptidase propeptide and YPEB domain
LLCASPAAPSYSAGQSATAPAALGPMMNEQQLEKQLNQQGYTSVGMIKLRGDTYEARAFKSGLSLAIEVDARTGKVLSADPAPRD